MLGVLGVALLGVLALVLTSNQINGKTEELAKVQVQEQGVKQVADALRPTASSPSSSRPAAADRDARLQPLRLGALAPPACSRDPRNVWLLDLTGTSSPALDVESAGGGGGLTNIREKVDAPAFSITGCTYSQHAVARMMTRMQNLDDVTDVQLAQVRAEGRAGHRRRHGRGADLERPAGRRAGLGRLRRLRPRHQVRPAGRVRRGARRLDRGPGDGRHRARRHGLGSTRRRRVAQGASSRAPAGGTP